MLKRRRFVSAILACVVLSGFVISASSQSFFFTEQPSALQTSDLIYAFPLNIVFLGFTTGVVDLYTLNNLIPRSYPYLYDNYTIDYGFNITFYSANSSYYSSFRDFCLTNSVNGTGTTSALNATALQIQINTGQKMSIFVPQSGRAIDAEKAEHWLETNPYVSTGPSYNFYVINLTELDAPAQNLQHWFNVTETDLEANRNRDFWRLEWDNPLNPDVKFPYALFTSDTRSLIIDTSAFQWYLTWAKLWYDLPVGGLQFGYYDQDLYQFSLTHDLSTSLGKSQLAYYLSGWINDPIENLLVSYLWTDSRIANARTMSIQTLVMNNASDVGYPNSAVEWMMNTTTVERSITDLVPFVNVTVTAQFHQLSEYPQLKQIFLNAVSSQTDGWTYYDGPTLWTELFNQRSVYFNLTAADIVINAYVLLEKNMSMMSNGREWTGLGGDGQILAMKEIQRYFEQDGITPRSSLVPVLIHEAGHNLGFPHTFSANDYRKNAGDFAFDVMGYYPYAYNFSQMRKDCFRRLVVDLKALDLSSRLNRTLTTYARKNPTSLIDAKIGSVVQAMNDSDEHYSKMQYLEADESISAAQTLTTDLEESVIAYLSDVNNDGKVNILDIVLLAVSFGSKTGDSNWNPICDLNKDGHINILDLAQVAVGFGKRWIS